MSLKGILSVSGLPGLYRVLTQTKSGFIVESLQDKKRTPVSSTQRISMLDDISIFTITDDIPLKEVLLKVREYAESNEVISAKSSSSELKSFFKSIIPDFDEERVYTSDIKKIINWYGLVKDSLDDEDDEETNEQTDAETDPASDEEGNEEEGGTDSTENTQPTNNPDEKK